MATISDQELAGLLAIKDLHAAMLANPDARDHVLRGAKIVKPDSVNELDVAERHLKPVRDELTKTKQEIADLQRQWAEKETARIEREKQQEFQSGWDMQKQKLRASGYMNSAVDAIEQLALKEGIPNLEHAAAVFDKTSPPPSVGRPAFGSLALMDGSAGDDQTEYMKKLFAGHGNAAGETRKQVAAALAESRGQRAA